MRNKAFPLVLLLAGLFACGSTPTEEEQVNQVITWLKGQGVQIDQVSDTNPPRLNTNRETETKEKTRKLKNGKPVKIKKDMRIGEVVVVAPGSNCKFEYEFVLNTGSTEVYPDEGRDANGKETELKPTINTGIAVGDALKQYVAENSNKGDPLAFCVGKPYVPSSHSND